MDISWDKKFADRVAQACISKFNSLRKTGKPKDKEWTLLACVVKQMQETGDLEVVALGTGSKCLGEKHMNDEGLLVHDSHAEVVARRAFVLYLLDQVENTAKGKPSIMEVAGDKFRIIHGISFHFYSSHTPCGDASIFPKQDWIESVGKAIISTAQQPSFNDDTLRCLNESSDSDVWNKLVTEPVRKKVKTEENDSEVYDEVNKLKDAKNESGINESSNTNSLQKKAHEVNVNVESRHIYVDIYRTGAKCVAGERADPKLSGSNYHVTGVLRTKPGRGDPTLSMSCSDKLFKWSVLGVQGSLLMLFLEAPLYIQTITIGQCPYSHEAMQRALFERFREKLQNVQFPTKYQISTPVLLHSDIHFDFSQCSVDGIGREGSKMMPSPASIIWSSSTHGNKHEVATNGHKQGATTKSLSTPKGSVSICRRSIADRVLGIMMDREYFQEILSHNLTYGDLKLQSQNYYNAWERLKTKVLCNWSVKPKYINLFTVNSSIGKLPG